MLNGHRKSNTPPLRLSLIRAWIKTKNTLMKTHLAVIVTTVCLSIACTARAEEAAAVPDSPPEESVASTDVQEEAPEETPDKAPETTPEEPSETIPEPAAFSTRVREFFDSDFFEQRIQGSLEVGARILYIKLLEDKKGEPFAGSFIGSVNQLEAKQNYFPMPYVQYVYSWWGLGLSWHQFEFEARDPGGSDGTATLNGPLFYAMARFTNETRFTPFAEMGMALYSATFDAEPNWAQRNRFDLEDSNGFYVAAGCRAQLTENWSVEAYLRRMNVDVDGTYRNLVDGRQQSFTFTATHIAAGFGACYTF